jgi:hypothetical protein
MLLLGRRISKGMNSSVTWVATSWTIRVQFQSPYRHVQTDSGAHRGGYFADDKATGAWSSPHLLLVLRLWMRQTLPTLPACLHGSLVDKGDCFFLYAACKFMDEVSVSGTLPDRAGWRSGNALHLYSEGSQLESRPRLWTLLIEVFVVFLSPSRKIPAKCFD